MQAATTSRLAAIAFAVFATVTQLTALDVLAYTQHAGAQPLMAALQSHDHQAPKKA